MTLNPHAVILISARQEWDAVKPLFPGAEIQASPLGEWFAWQYEIRGCALPVIYFHGGWGKIAAAASAQYVVDRWNPRLLVNLGTCGGFAGEIEQGAIVLVEKAVVYDIVEQMGDPAAALAQYTSSLDLGWLGEPYPQEVVRTLIVSGDRDLVIEEIPRLKACFGAVAGDWESGSIAFVAVRNGVRCLILRGVSDLVGSDGDAAYGNLDVFIENTHGIMPRLVAALPDWLEKSLD